MTDLSSLNKNELIEMILSLKDQLDKLTSSNRPKHKERSKRWDADGNFRG